MRKIIILTFISLDGVMQAPGGPKEDTSGGFEYGGWTVPYFDEFMNGVMGEQMTKPLTCCLEEGHLKYLPHIGRNMKINGLVSTQ